MDGIRKKPKHLPKRTAPQLPVHEVSSPQAGAIYGTQKETLAFAKNRQALNPSFSSYSLSGKARLSSRPRKKKKTISWKQKATLLIILFLLLPIMLIGFFSWKIARVAESVTGERTTPITIMNTARSTLPTIFSTQELDDTSIQPLKGQQDGRINILLLGKASDDQPGQNLTDTIMIASIDTVHYKTSLLSLPRDLYVEIGETGTHTKINALYTMGTRQDEPMKYIQPAVETVTGLDIHYFVMIDYDGFVQIVDALGGIHVMVERDIKDTRFPGPNYSYETFELKKGLQKLDGSTALKYVRERHSDPDGDFGRAKRQQQTLQSIRNKASSLGTILNPLRLTHILNALEHNIQTNIKPEDIESFLVLGKKLDTHNVSTLVIDAWEKESLLRVYHVYLENGQRMFALTPRSGNWNEIHDAAKNIFFIEEQKVRAEKIRSEQASVIIVDSGVKTSTTKKIQSLLEDLGMHVEQKKLDTPLSSPPMKTTIFDNANLAKPFSLDEIIKRIGATKRESFEHVLPLEETPDFILILGKDIETSYDEEEATLEEYRNSQ